MTLRFITSTAAAVGLFLSAFPAYAACTYSLKDIKIEWTGYKFTEKLGVPGSFREISVSQPAKAASVDELISNTSFLINAMTVDSGVPLRDDTLRDGFFKLMSSPYIKGYVEGYDSKKKTAQVFMNMNGTSRSEKFDVTVTKSEVQATSSIDVMHFMMSKSMLEINKKCSDLHKGKDGISKTWSEVGLKITAKISENCKK